MVTSSKSLGCVSALLLGGLCLSQAQTSSRAPVANASPAALVQAVNPTAKSSDNSAVLLVQASAPSVSPAAATSTAPASSSTATPIEPDNLTENGGVGVREFQGDDVGQVLRLLARQAKINMVVSEAVVGTVTMRLEDVTALQAIAIIVKAKGLFMDKIDNVYYIKTGAERTAEPTESDNYQFSYARAKDVAPLVAGQLSSKDAPQIDERTITIFYRETRTNMDNIHKLLAQIDRPTKQVMIEARLVEVTANPRQSYGINWAGVVGSSTSAKTLRLVGGDPAGVPTQTVNPDGSITTVPGTPPHFTVDTASGQVKGNDFFRDTSDVFKSLAGQFAILSVPQ